MRIVDGSIAQLLHHIFTYIDDSRPLLRIQCRSNVGAEKLTAHMSELETRRGEENDDTSRRNAPAKPVPTKKKSGA